jgi:hypothetical protein
MPAMSAGLACLPLARSCVSALGIEHAGCGPAQHLLAELGAHPQFILGVEPIDPLDVDHVARSYRIDHRLGG